MTAFILAIVAGLIGVLPQILKMIEAHSNANKKVAHDLAELELKQTRDALAAVDAQLDGVQPDQRQPVLLPPDDRV